MTKKQKKQNKTWHVLAGLCFNWQKGAHSFPHSLRPHPLLAPHPAASVSPQTSGDSWLKGNIFTPSVSSEPRVCLVFSPSSAGNVSRRHVHPDLWPWAALDLRRDQPLLGLQWMVMAAGVRSLFKVGNIPPHLLGDSKSKSAADCVVT